MRRLHHASLFATTILSVTAFSHMALAQEAPKPAPTATTLSEAFSNGKFNAELRYRYEFVDQDNIAKQAYASTLRSRLGFTTAALKGFSGTAEVENVAPLFGSKLFNSTENGITDRPTVADPTTTVLNQFYLQYAGLPATKMRLGRQAINLGNKRFISTLDWRQNDRTFDAFTIENKSIKDLSLYYGYSNKIEQSITAALEGYQGKTHIANATYSGLKDSLGVITAYAYALDFDSAAAAARSSNTYGVNLTGEHALGSAKLGYYLEYANQTDAGDNAVDYDADYVHIKPTLAWNGFDLAAGYEKLGSDNGARAIDTPFGLVHAFNGWADIFVNTPANGLEDAYASLYYTVKAEHPLLNGLKLGATYHDFSADEGSADYGTEWDLEVAKKFKNNISASLVYASYDSDTFAQDTDKVYLVVGWKY